MELFEVFNNRRSIRGFIKKTVSHGLKGCLVDFINISEINNILGLPENITCQLLVPIGCPKEIYKIKKKKNDKNKIFFNQWT